MYATFYYVLLLASKEEPEAPVPHHNSFFLDSLSRKKKTFSTSKCFKKEENNRVKKLPKLVPQLPTPTIAIDSVKITFPSYIQLANMNLQYIKKITWNLSYGFYQRNPILEFLEITSLFSAELDTLLLKLSTRINPIFQHPPLPLLAFSSKIR